MQAEEAVRNGLYPRIDQHKNEDGTFLYQVFDSVSGEPIASAPNIKGALEIAQTHSEGVYQMTAEKIAYLGSILQAGEAALTMGKESTGKNTFDLGKIGSEAWLQAEEAGSIDAYREEAAARNLRNGGTKEENLVALGYHKTQFIESVRHWTNKLFKGASVTTGVHETFHGLYRKALAAGTVSQAEALQFVRAVDAVYGDKMLKRGALNGERLSLLPVGITDEQVTPKMIDEALSEIAEADILMNRKRDAADKAIKLEGGIISRNLMALKKAECEGRFDQFDGDICPLWNG